MNIRHSRVILFTVLALGAASALVLAQSPAWLTGIVRGSRRLVNGTTNLTINIPAGVAVPANGTPVWWTTTNPTAPPQPPPPPPAASLYGTVDPQVLGTCAAVQHDAHAVDGGDGFRYRTWHSQIDPSGCVYAHEHGDDPRRVGHPEILSLGFPAFGRIQRKAALVMPHAEEPHQGFKVFVALPGDTNDEGRVNRVYSLATFHMGTGGPARFTQPMHSADIRVVHPEFGLTAFTQLMMDTGGVGAVCDPRSPAPVKDVMRLDAPQICGRLIESSYEIWSTQQSVFAPDGREVYRAFATPAVFDPITVFNPANPTETVYACDARMTATRQWPDNDWSHFRGCDRESYAQPGYWHNLDGAGTYTTDAMGRPVAAGSPAALVQTISRSESVGVAATVDGLQQFKMRRNYCAAGLGVKN